MKATLAFILLLFSSITFSQSSWFWQNPTPQGSNINSITFINSQTGIAVGNHGTILQTTNGGENWNLTYVSYRNDFRSVHHVSGTTVFVAGTEGIILRTTNSGNSWERISSNITDTISSIYFTDQNFGYVACNRGKVFKSTDGGITWNEQSSGITTALNSIFFLNQDTGYVCGDNGRVIRTTNAGSNWNSIANIQGVDYNSVWFRDYNYGFIAGGSQGNREFRRTTNGGQSWLAVLLAISAGELTQIVFVDNNTGYISGKLNTLFITTNGGVNWGFDNTITQASFGFNTIHFNSPQEGYLAGTYGILYKTTNGATGWNQKLPNGSTEYVREIEMPDNQAGFVLTANKLLKTTNAGNNWNIIADNFSRHYEMQFIDGNLGFVLRDYILFRTTNGAATWAPISQSVDSVWSYQFTDASTGFALKTLSSPTLCRTSNSGQSWTNLDIENLYFYNFPNNMIGYGVTETFIGGIGLVKTTSSGLNWSYVRNLVVDSLTRTQSLYFLDENTGFSIQAYASISSDDRIFDVYRTSNGGMNWTEVYTTGQFYLPWTIPIDYKINFTNLSTGYLAGVRDTTFKTTDAGITWAKYNVGDRPIKEIEFINDNTGYMIGSGGMILKTTNGGTVSILEVSSGIPKQFLLIQNFPNPFNPRTTIKYELPVEGNVKLSVYDPVGRLVTILVDEFKVAGNYDVVFGADPGTNGNALPSGIYFAVLEVGNRRESLRTAMVK